MDDMERRTGAAKPEEKSLVEQMLSPQERQLRDEAYAFLDIFREGCMEYHQKMQDARDVVRMNDPNQDKPNEQHPTLQLQTLKSTFANCVADQMDNMPEAHLLPEREGLEQTAQDMEDVVRFILDQNKYEALHRRRVEDYLMGTAVTQIVWDDDMDNGQGNVALIRWPLENFLWDPGCEDIQAARALIKVSWHPLSWFAEHYPERAAYIGSDDGVYAVGKPKSWREMSGDEDRAMLMEYWYRRYDAKKKRYTINVAFLAGGALLENDTNVYRHGMYPFVVEPFDYIEGQPVGDGLVSQLAPMMRYINRYARYIDENARMSAKNKLLVRKNAQLDMDALTDFDANVVEGASIEDDSVRWFQSKQFNGLISQQMLQFQTDMKQDSGQSQWTRGETAGGVTAAAAISALQEAGGKITREHTQMLNAGFKRIVEQMLWLVNQFYTDKKCMMITGRDGKPRSVDMSAAHLRGDDAPLPAEISEEQLAQIDRLLPAEGNIEGVAARLRRTMQRKREARAEGNVFAPPPYTVQIQINRRNPLRVQAQNELFIQAYTMAAQAGQVFPLWVLFDMLTVDGKERIVPVLKEVDQTTQMIQQMQAQIQQLTESNESLKQMVSEANRQITDQAGRPPKVVQQSAPQTRAQAQPQGGASARQAADRSAGGTGDADAAMTGTPAGKSDM